MKLFIYEHITSGALVDQILPDSLAQEGGDMLAALLNDCHALIDLELTILRDARLAKIDLIENNARHHCHIVTTPTDFQYLWTQCLNDADAVFIIAPETDNILTELQQQVVDVGKTILGCQPAAIALTTNKLLCDQQLQQHTIPVPRSCLASAWQQQKFEHADGYIVKPIDGAGCIDTLVFDTIDKLEHYLNLQSAEQLQQRLIQSYHRGTPASLSLLMSTDHVLVLAKNLQKIACKHGSLIFNGCIVNGVDQKMFSLEQSTKLAQQIQHAIAGLWGFVGVDLILTKQEAIVVDINPRLTTSYIGLRQSLALNPMDLLFILKEHGIIALPAITQYQQVDVFYD